MRPQKSAKKPISAIKQRAETSHFRVVIFWWLKISARPKARRMAPWPISPNMTPKRKGKVMLVKTAGLISLYRGRPQVYTISLGTLRNQLAGKQEGGESRLSLAFLIKQPSPFLVLFSYPMTASTSAVLSVGTHTNASRKPFCSVNLQIASCTFSYRSKAAFIMYNLLCPNSVSASFLKCRTLYYQEVWSSCCNYSLCRVSQLGLMESGGAMSSRTTPCPSSIFITLLAMPSPVSRTVTKDPVACLRIRSEMLKKLITAFPRLALNTDLASLSESVYSHTPTINLIPKSFFWLNRFLGRCYESARQAAFWSHLRSFYLISSMWYFSLLQQFDSCQSYQYTSYSFWYFTWALVPVRLSPSSWTSYQKNLTLASEFQMVLNLEVKELSWGPGLVTMWTASVIAMAATTQ